jgi:integrase
MRKSCFSKEGAIMRREYYLHKRKNGIYYVEFIDKVSGSKLSARSTGETEKLKAQVKAELWKISGIPTGRLKKPRPIEEAAGIESCIKLIRRSELNSDDALRIVSTLKSMGLIDIAAVKNTGRGAVPFIQFLETFWDYDKSEYIRDRLSHGYRFSRSYARGCQNRLKAELMPFFGDKKLNCVTTDDLKKLSYQLADRGLSTSTINQVLLVACTPLKWAFTEKIIPSNPVIGLTKFSITNKERGILTEAEAKAVFSVEWKDKRAFVASLVAATTGARQGECLALRRSDIKEDTLNIIYNYSTLDGLKCPKNGHKRVVPLLPVVRAAILDLLNDNPHVDKDKPDPAYDPFIFYSLQPDKPCDQKYILNGFKEAMDTVNAEYEKAAKKANLEKPEIFIDYKSRNIIFHSWRHWFCSKLTEKIEGEKVAKVSGHLSESVFKKYADHIETKNIQEVGNAAAQAFGNVLQFRKAG